MSEDGRDESCADDGPRQVPGQARAPLDDVDRTVPAQRDRREDSVLPVRPPSDADLITWMRSGDDRAYEELYRRHAGAVRRYARTCCRDAHTADDLTAEVFARMLQAVRGGSGPHHAVRAYLLTSVRRVAAVWTHSAKREHLVPDFAAFVTQAARLTGASDADTLDLGADVRAMHEAEQSLAIQAFLSLPERWQAVLWHTEVEDESPSEIAPLFGLDANGTRVLAGRAREALKQAYLQAHVSAALAGDEECARYAGRLGTYARGRLRTRAERGLRRHLEACARCRLAAGQIEEVAAGIPALVPVAVLGWLGPAGYAKVAGLAVGGSTGAVGSKGMAAPAKAGLAAGVVAVAAAAAVALALSGDEPPAQPRMAAPAAPSAPVFRENPPPPEKHATPKPPRTSTRPGPVPKPTPTPTPRQAPTPTRVPASSTPPASAPAAPRTELPRRETRTRAKCNLPPRLVEVNLSIHTDEAPLVTLQVTLATKPHSHVDPLTVTDWAKPRFTCT